ncbi:MAG: YihY/virulence factor BrkB family protein [Bacteroidales bacterium]|nr:YihY/virulence factor BrkB family protein [Bacteroidales bacterium]
MFRKIIDFIKKLVFVNFIVNLSKKIILPGFDSMPLYDVSVFFFRGLMKSSITQRASAISFNMFMALFPAVIFIFTLIAYVPIKDFHIILLNNISHIVPDNAYDMVHMTLEDIVSRQRGGLLSIGFILAFVFSTNGIMSLMAAFNSTYHAIETRSLLWQYIISFFLVIVLTLLVILSVSLIIFGTDMLKYLLNQLIVNSKLIFNLLYMAKWLLIILSLFLAISLIFFIAPAKKTRFRFISAGSTLSTILFVVTSVAFNYYINHFSQYNKLYGSIGTLLIIMFWIYINAIVILIGFELNASIKQARMVSVRSQRLFHRKKTKNKE